MQYFTSELWYSLSSSDPKVRERADEQWENAWNQYRAYLDGILPKLSQRKRDAVIRCHDLHDSEIETIVAYNKQTRRKHVVNVKIVLDNRIVVFTNVTSFAFSVQNQDDFHAWGYCEFEALQDNKMKISILCDLENQISMVFEGIEIHRRVSRGRFS